MIEYNLRRLRADISAFQYKEKERSDERLIDKIRHIFRRAGYPGNGGKLRRRTGA